MPDEVIYCARHQNVPTNLFCGKCEKPICPKCSVSGPVGQRCRECAKGPKVGAYEVPWYTYAVAAVISAAAGILAGRIINFVGFLVIFVAPIVGGFIGQIVFLAANRKRGRGLAYVAGGGIVLGALLGLFFTGFSPLYLVSLGIYVVMAAPAAYWRLM